VKRIRAGTQSHDMCPHRPPCPPADWPDRAEARCVVRNPEQGWSLLCNGVILFDDTGEFLPDGRALPCVARPESSSPLPPEIDPGRLTIGPDSR
jgi:Family of unknown function (DUF5999)